MIRYERGFIAPAVLGALLLGILSGGLSWSASSALARQEETREEETREEPAVKKIKMQAENWRWRPDVIRVRQGTRVIIDFSSYDASHSFVLKAYGLKLLLPEGKKERLEFVADKAGEFKWRCGRPCGDGCPKMTGKLIVFASEVE